jgi:riboflavin synthase
MFTGLVEDTGAIIASRPAGNGRSLTIRTRIPAAEIAIGDSIACDGVCLTAETIGSDSFTVTAGIETLQKTTVGSWSAGRSVHLERALRVGDRLGGHLVQGHVDGVAEVASLSKAAESVVIWIRAPGDLAKYVVTKGSICVDGVSLTVNEVQDLRSPGGSLRASSTLADGSLFRVNIIPHTATVTRLGGLSAGDRVNLEVDLLARYVERLLGGSAGGLTEEKLRQHGFAP